MLRFNLFENLMFYFLSKKRVIHTNLVPIDEINEIFCFSNTAIGDTLFSTPVFRILKKNFPNKKIIAILNPKNYELFETNPYIDEIMLYNGKTKYFFHFLKKLKQKQPRLILLLHSNEPQATPLSVLSGAKYIIKIPNDKSPFNKWHTNKIFPKIKGEHYIKIRLKFLEYLGIYEKDCKMDLFLKEKWKEKIDNFFKGISYSKLIGFQIGASTISRRWFNDKWALLGKKILKKYPNVKVILTGSPNEKYLTNEVEKLINHKNILNLAGKFSLGEAAALINKLDLLVTPDTGPLHIATALKTPTVALFAAANYLETNACYDKDIHLYIQKEHTCFPCIDKSCKFPKCMEQISVDEVLEKVDKVLVNAKTNSSSS